MANYSDSGMNAVQYALDCRFPSATGVLNAVLDSLSQHPGRAGAVAHPMSAGGLWYIWPLLQVDLMCFAESMMMKRLRALAEEFVDLIPQIYSLVVPSTLGFKKSWMSCPVD